MGVVKYLKHNIDSILVSLILNINVLRFFLNTGETNIVLYALYIGTILVLWYRNQKSVLKIYQQDKIIKYYINYWILLLGYSLVTCVFITNELATFFKFCVAIIIAILCIGEDLGKKKTIFIWFYSINILYGIIILMNTDRIYLYMEQNNVNYLNMTLTLGFAFTMGLVEIVYSLYNRKNIIIIFSLGVSIFMFFVLMVFAARGVLLFPPLIMIIVAFLKGGQNKGRLFIFLVVFTLLVVCAAQYFLENMSGYALSHMTNLFEDSGEESRLDVWSVSVNAILDNLWLFWGAGCNGMDLHIGFYPHNIFLQILGDFGFFFLISFVAIVFIVIKRIGFAIKNIKDSYQQEIVFFCASGFLYYLLTFCKSFSMYDSCPLIILMSMCLTLKNTSSNKRNHRTVIVDNQIINKS